jgi:hypothetical protein
MGQRSSSRRISRARSGPDVARHAQCNPFISMRRVLAQGLVEYGLIIAFVALLAVASLLLFRPALPSLLSHLAASV